MGDGTAEPMLIDQGIDASHDDSPSGPLLCLPRTVLSTILGNLDGKDLARLAVQSRNFRRVVAEEEPLWRTVCMQRWPDCILDGHATWQEVYRERMWMPNTFLMCLDKSHAQRLLASDMAADASSEQLKKTFGTFLQSAFTVFLALEVKAELHKTAEYQIFCEDLRWWLEHDPELLVGYVRSTDIHAQEFDMWGTGFVNWPDIPWRRSVVQMVLDCEDVARVISEDIMTSVNLQLASLDNTIQSIEEEADNLRLPVPRGVPQRHWWFFIHGAAYQEEDAAEGMSKGNNSGAQNQTTATVAGAASSASDAMRMRTPRSLGGASAAATLPSEVADRDARPSERSYDQVARDGLVENVASGEPIFDAPGTVMSLGRDEDDYLRGRGDDLDSDDEGDVGWGVLPVADLVDPDALSLEQFHDGLYHDLGDVTEGLDDDFYASLAAL